MFGARTACGMIDLLYNGILVVLVIVWTLAVCRPHKGRVVKFVKKHRVVVAVLLWAAFLALLVAFVAKIDYFTEIHDIDDAVEAATSHFLHGGNPYVDEVVPRFSEKYHPDPEFANGTYNYLPLDLLIYSGANSALSPIGAPAWFVLVNLVFSGAALFLFRRVVRTEWMMYVPIAGVVMIFYSYDNASFTLLLMVASIYLWRMRSERTTYLAVFLLSMATMTKAYAAIPLAVLVLFELQSRISARDVKRIGRILLIVAGCALLALALMLPFGISNVLDSAVFFHASEQSREETSAGGTLLSEIGMGSPYYGMASVLFVVAAIVFSMRMKNLDDRVLLVMSAFLLVVVKSSYAPLTVLGVYLGSRLYDVLHSGPRADNAEIRSSVSAADDESSPSGTDAQSVLCPVAYIRQSSQSK